MVLAKMVRPQVAENLAFLCAAGRVVLLSGAAIDFQPAPEVILREATVSS